MRIRTEDVFSLEAATIRIASSIDGSSSRAQRAANRRAQVQSGKKVKVPTKTSRKVAKPSKPKSKRKNKAFNNKTKIRAVPRIKMLKRAVDYESWKASLKKEKIKQAHQLCEDTAGSDRMKHKEETGLEKMMELSATTQMDSLQNLFRLELEGVKGLKNKLKADYIASGMPNLHVAAYPPLPVDLPVLMIKAEEAPSCLHICAV